MGGGLTKAKYVMTARGVGFLLAMLVGGGGYRSLSYYFSIIRVLLDGNIRPIYTYIQSKLPASPDHCHMQAAINEEPASEA